MICSRVSIIILNWNGWKDTIECLESVYQNAYANYEVLVVDNGSKDNSIEMIKKWASGDEKILSSYFTYSKKNKPIKYFEYTKKELELRTYLRGKKKLDPLPSNRKLFIINNDKNYGFAEGNNIAIRQVLNENKSDYLFLLNNDTYIPKDTISKFVNSYIGNNKIAIVGAKILSYSDKTFQIGAKYVNFYTCAERNVNSNNSVFSDSISGCAFMVKLSNISGVKPLFDPYYFCYYEDLDFFQNYKKNGYRILYNPDIEIFHKLSKSTGGDSSRSMFRYYYIWRNRLYFVGKNATKFKKTIFFLYFFLIYIPFIRIPASLVKYRSIKEIRVFFEAINDYFKRRET